MPHTLKWLRGLSRADLETGHFDRGITLARRVLDVDPNAEHVEVCLLRLYRASGAHAAAAEQYGHYATLIARTVGNRAASARFAVGIGKVPY